MPLEKITLAIPFYRGWDYLERAVRSVLAQDDSGWELLICDDAGPEGDLSERLARLLPPGTYRYVRGQERLGMAGNWNRCLELSRTDLVTLLHADDELLPNYVGSMLRAAREFPEVAAHFCQARIIGADGRRAFSFVDAIKPLLQPDRKAHFHLRGESGTAALLRGNFIMCPTLCYRKSRLGPLLFDPRWKMVLDLDFTTRLLMAGQTLHGIPEVAYSYRRHAENATALYTEDLSRFDEEVRLYGRLAEEAKARGWNQAAKIAERKTIIRLHLLFRIAGDLVRLRFGAGLKKARYFLSLG